MPFSAGTVDGVPHLYEILKNIDSFSGEVQFYQCSIWEN